MDSVKNGKIALNRRQTVFENARFQVFADHIADGQGNEVRDFLVVAPRNRTGVGLTGTVVVPVRAGLPPSHRRSRTGITSRLYR